MKLKWYQILGRVLLGLLIIALAPIVLLVAIIVNIDIK